MTEALPQQDRLIFSESALQNRASSANAAGQLSPESAFLVVLLEEQKTTQRLYGELCAEIERLKTVAQLLQDAMFPENTTP